MVTCMAIFTDIKRGLKPLFWGENSMKTAELGNQVERFMEGKTPLTCVSCTPRLEKEHSSVRRQLTTEVETKKTTIGNLSKELQVHQKNFIELKEELSKVLLGTIAWV